MDSVIIKNAQGEQMNINVIRYFRLNGIEYLVFSLNEVDEGGYVKLYISKVNNEFANTITDDVEWNLIKDTIKTIIKSNKENLPLSITDLDIKKLSDIQLVDQKVFKLSETYINLLNANKKIEPYVETVTSVMTPNLSPVDNNSIAEEVDLNSIQQNPITEFNPTVPTQETMQNVFENSILSPLSTSVVEPVTSESAPVINEFINPSNTEIPVVESNPIEAPTTSENIGNNSEYGLDFKTLYENELNKNKLLSEENDKYKTMFDSLKKIINENETF